MGRSLFKIIPSIAADEATMKAIRLAEKGIKSFVPVSKDYIHRHHAENHFIPLKNSDENFIGIMNLVHDVAHRIKAEEQLQYLNNELLLKNKELEQRNAELISLSNVASHDLKEPLQKIYTAGEAIISTDAKKLSDNSKAHLRRIQSSVQKMRLITDDLLSFTALTKERNEEEYSPVPLDAVMEKAKKRLQRIIENKNALIELGELPSIYGNQHLLIQLFQHIIHNAVKFQEKNNQPVIKISSEKVKYEDKDFWKVSVRDNGIGFKEGEAELIFNLFTKLGTPLTFSGSGIGLAVYKKIMEKHRGFIRAISEEGKGTEMSCYFPE